MRVLALVREHHVRGIASQAPNAPQRFGPRHRSCLGLASAIYQNDSMRFRGFVKAELVCSTLPQCSDLNIST
jgi:hypothetical protein